MIPISDRQQKKNSGNNKNTAYKRNIENKSNRNHGSRKAAETDSKARRTGQKQEAQKHSMSHNGASSKARTGSGHLNGSRKNVQSSGGWVISPVQDDRIRSQNAGPKASAQQRRNGQKQPSSGHPRPVQKKRSGKKRMSPISKLALLIVLSVIVIVLLIEGVSAWHHSKVETETNNALQYSTSSSSVTSPVSDASAYPEGTDPETLGSLTQLINRTHGLPTDYEPPDLVEIDLPSIRVTSMRAEAAAALAELFAAAEEDGVSLLCCSGFRSYETQAEVYANSVSSVGEEETYMTTAQPGFSEHQSGLAMDITSDSVNQTLTTDFIDTTEGKWLERNAYKYGFIIRYLKGMEDITGYSYEPWHIRYLGKDVAKAVYKSGSTYEEYLGILD